MSIYCDDKPASVLPGLSTDRWFYRIKPFKTADPKVVLKAEIPTGKSVRRLYWRIDPKDCTWFARRFNEWNPVLELCSKEFIDEMSKKYDNIYLSDFTRELKIEDREVFDKYCKRFKTLSDVRAYERDLIHQVINVSRTVSAVQDTYYSYD